MTNKTYIFSAKSPGKNISAKTDIELEEMALAGISIEAVMQEAIKRRNPKIMYMLTRSDHILSHPAYCKLILDFIEKTPNLTDKMMVLDGILFYPPQFVSQRFDPRDLISLGIQNKSLAALLILSKGTPAATVKALIEHEQLSSPRRSPFVPDYPGTQFNQNFPGANQTLKKIISLLQEGYAFENSYAYQKLAGRLEESTIDPFSTEIAKYNISPEVAQQMSISVSKYGKVNANLKKNFEGNHSSGKDIWEKFQGLYELGDLEHPPAFAKNMAFLADLLQKQDSEKYLTYAWETISNACGKSKKYPEIFAKILNYYSNGENFLLGLAKKSQHLCSMVLDTILKAIGNDDTIYKQYMAVLNPIFTLAQKKYGLDDKLSKLNPGIKSWLGLETQSSPKTTQPSAKQPAKPKPKEYTGENIDEDIMDIDFDIGDSYIKQQDSRGLMEKTSGWYAVYKEAGLKEKISKGGILAALSFLLLSGPDKIKEAAERFSVNIQELAEAWRNPQMIEEAQNLENAGQEQAEPNYNDFLQDLRGHEGLRLNRYNDHLGNPTIGWGHLITPGENLQRITREQADTLLAQDARSAWDSAQQILGQTDHPPEVQRVVANMVYQMGERNVRGFRNTLQHLNNGDYAQAADEMLNSPWARVQTPTRARELASRIRNLAN